MTSEAGQGSVTYTASLPDTLAAYRLAARLTRRQRLVMALLIAGSVLLLATAIALRLPDSVIAVCCMLLGAALGGYGWRWLYNFLFRPRRVRRIYTQQKDLQAAQTITWSAAGLGATSRRGTVLIPWTDYAYRRQDRTTILLYKSDAIFHFMPRRLFDAAQSASLSPLIAPIPLRR